MSPPGRIREVLAEHRVVVEAIEAGDAPAARDAMKRHLGVTGELVEKFARQRPGMFAV
jgi:DNA-binding GntR family transcriptional regulator